LIQTTHKTMNNTFHHTFKYFTSTSLLLLFVSSGTGCDKIKAKFAKEKAPVKTVKKDVPDAGADLGSADASRDMPPEEEPPLMGATDFGNALPEGVCTMLAECKNEELVRYFYGAGGMLLSFAAMDKELKPEIDVTMAHVKAMEKDKKVKLEKPECMTAVSTLTKVFGYSASALQTSLDEGKIVVDELKAAECLASLTQGPTLCKTELKFDATKKLGYKELQVLEKKYSADIMTWTTACHEMIKGQVKDGEPCLEKYECKGNKVRCSSPQLSKAGDPKVCIKGR